MSLLDSVKVSMFIYVPGTRITGEQWNAMSHPERRTCLTALAFGNCVKLFSTAAFAVIMSATGIYAWNDLHLSEDERIVIAGVCGMITSVLLLGLYCVILNCKRLLAGLRELRRER
ncbi:MAG: hypothetical protein AAGA03_12215 [Planctomycetota bacterium]